MARIDGRGPKPQIQFINEWTTLKSALATLRTWLYETNLSIDYPTPRDAAVALLDEVPRLMDAHAELWELMEAAVQAQEKLAQSKNDLYVPDAAELVAGVANPERTQR